MALFLFGIIIAFGFIIQILEKGDKAFKDIPKNQKKQKEAKEAGSIYYIDTNGVCRHTETNECLKLFNDGSVYDKHHHKIYDPYKNKNIKSKEDAIKLGYSKYRLYAGEDLSDYLYDHTYHYISYVNVEEDSNKKSYGKLNCNLGYQFYVDLQTGKMEETELSKKIPHTELIKYHKKPVDKRKRKVQQYVDDYNNPYSKNEIEEENKRILKHLENHNNNVENRNNLPNKQKFAPDWCYTPMRSEYEGDDNPYNDDIIFSYMYKLETKPLIEVHKEGWYD